MKIFFYTIGILGAVLILVLAFTVPDNPFEIVPSYTAFGFDKPIWLAIFIVGTFLYWFVLFVIYDKISKKK